MWVVKNELWELRFESSVLTQGLAVVACGHDAESYVYGSHEVDTRLPVLLTYIWLSPTMGCTYSFQGQKLAKFEPQFQSCGLPCALFPSVALSENHPVRV